MINCPLCNQELPDDAEECFSCGNPNLNPLAEPVYDDNSHESKNPLHKDFVHPLLKIKHPPKEDSPKQEEPAPDQEQIAPPESLEESHPDLEEKTEEDLPTSTEQPSESPKTAHPESSEEEVETPPPSQKSPVKRPQRRIVVGSTLIISILILTGTALHLISLHDEKEFASAISTRDVEKANVLAKNHPERLNTVRLLEVVVAEQARQESFVKKNRQVLSQYDRENWTKVETLLISAKETPSLVQALLLYRQVDMATEQCRTQLKGLIDIRTSIQTLTSGPFGATRLARYFPTQWAEIVSDIAIANKELNIEQAEDLWREIDARIRLLQKEAASKSLAEERMLVEKKNWQTALSTLQEKNPEALTNLQVFAPELTKEIATAEMRATAFAKVCDFKEAETLYKNLSAELQNALTESEKQKEEVIYQTAVTEATAFSKEGDWSAAYQALDRADASAHPDHSTAIRLRMSIDFNLEAVETARSHYEKTLSTTDIRQLQQAYPSQWNELKKNVQHADQVKSLADKIRIYTEATQQLKRMRSSDQKLQMTTTLLAQGIPSPDLPWQASINDQIKMDFAPIDSGIFFMGSDKSEPYEKPVHIVHISEPFWIGYFEVTLEQFSQFIRENDTLHTTFHERSGFPLIGTNFTLRGNATGSDWKQPICSINWREAVQFCSWLTSKEHAAGRLDRKYQYALPTEAQWEYACRAGKQESFQGNLSNVAWHKENSDLRTHPVGQKEPNSWGLYDMQGNVAEWCEDNWHNNFYGAPDDGSAWLTPNHSQRVFRGGSFYSSPDYCQYSSRGLASESIANTRCGFRVALVKTKPEDK